MLQLPPLPAATDPDLRVHYQLSDALTTDTEPVLWEHCGGMTSLTTMHSGLTLQVASSPADKLFRLVHANKAVASDQACS